MVFLQNQPSRQWRSSARNVGRKYIFAETVLEGSEDGFRPSCDLETPCWQGPRVLFRLGPPGLGVQRARICRYSGPRHSMEHRMNYFKNLVEQALSPAAFLTKAAL